MKKIAYLAGYSLDLTQIWYRGVFLDSKSKINNKILIGGHSRQNDVKGNTCISLEENAYDVIMTSFLSNIF